MSWLLFPFLLAFSSCSLQKVALRSSTPIFEKSSMGLMKESNWEFFRVSAPGNLKFSELIWDQDQGNLRLLSVLIKGYAGYAFGVHETLALRDDLAGLEDSPSKKEAIFFYTRALDYGLRYLDEKGASKELLLSNKEADLLQKLSKLDEEDFTAILYTAQAWGSLINLQKDNVALVTQIPKVKIMFDRVCGERPEMDHNICDIFYAQYISSRPKMLGGDPEKGEKLFLEAIAKNPMNLLIRVNYIQSVLLPAYELKKYEAQALILKNEFLKWENLNRDSLENLSPYRDVQELNLYNSIAKKRFQMIEEMKTKIF